MIEISVEDAPCESAPCEEGDDPASKRDSLVDIVKRGKADKLPGKTQ